MTGNSLHSFRYDFNKKSMYIALLENLSYIRRRALFRHDFKQKADTLLEISAIYDGEFP
jgi:hypothetical protein